ncbi:MAG: integrase core domain-containing protein, partial [Streptosporangiaceae bacterium]
RGGPFSGSQAAERKPGRVRCLELCERLLVPCCDRCEQFDAVFQSAGARVIQSAVQAPRMNSIMERWIGSYRRELLDRTLVWNQRHLMIVLREYEDFYNTHQPHRALKQAAPVRPLPDGVADLDRFRVQRRDRAGGVIHEYRLMA